MSLQKIKKTAYLALILLLVCTVMLGAVSYAWLSLSRAPEISGIETNIGSNGSLEIALLTESTFIDPSTIKTKVGSSLEGQDATISNLFWGNVIDLDDSSYGLGNIALVPARLDVTDALVVNSGLLKVPGYGADGRFTEFSNDTASGIYSVDQFGVGSFLFSSAGQSYGVRGVGKLAGISAQESALAISRTAVRAYTNAAKADLAILWENNGAGLLEILHYLYGGKDVVLECDPTMDLLQDTAEELLEIYDYVDSALRQGIIGYASLLVQDEETFKLVKQGFEDKSVPLSLLIDTLPVTLPEGYGDVVNEMESQIASLQMTVFLCKNNRHEYDDYFLRMQIVSLISPDWAYINDVRVRSWENNVTLTEDNRLTLYGVNSSHFQQLIRYVGDYNAFFQYDGVSVEVTTLMEEGREPFLEQTYAILDQADDSDDEDYIKVTPLDDVCGFAVDMAFRCNQDSDLLLQTMPDVRIEGDEYAELNNTQGGGSFMRFNSEELTTEQMVHLVDALRIGFMDNQNNLIAVAKLNTSNYQETEDGVTAPLYLYDFTAYADGRIEIGERRSENSAVTSLSQNKEKVITIVVWLDGDYIDNSHASIVNNSMTGTLNLQFSSSADLKPALPDDSGNPDATVPGETEPEVTIPEDQPTYYLSVDGNDQYTVYTLDQAGNRDYEMPFEGMFLEDESTVVITSVSDYPVGGVVIPAVVMVADTQEQYFLSVNAEGTFAKIGSACESISFVSVEGVKVGINGTVLTNFISDKKALLTFDGSGLDTSGVTDMSYMFHKCSNLTTVNVSNWDTSNVTNMIYLFADCKSVQELDVTAWNTAKVTKMSYMFNWCASLTKLDASGLDMGNVTAMQGMFSSCTALKELNINGLDTSKVENMMELFHMSSSLEKLDLSEWDTSSLVAASYMFSYCENLKELDLSEWNMANVTNARYMFYECADLTQLKLPDWDLSDVDDYEMFTGCPAGENYS